MFYLYALPMGMLASRLEAFRVTCEQLFGLNDAHLYPVHVILTRKFSLEAERVGEFQRTLSKHFAGVGPFHVGGLKHIAHKQLVLLELTNDRIATATRNWALEFGRPDIEVIDAGFHVTIAWKTPSHNLIFELARPAIDRSLDVQWKVALCERLDEGRWQPHDGVMLL